VTGPAGFGRYDSDWAHVACPFARTRRSPCIARDGRLALEGGVICEGCAMEPAELAEALAVMYPPAEALRAAGDPVTLADSFAEFVREMTEPGREDDGEGH
jgi:hypothetical protein